MRYGRARAGTVFVLFVLFVLFVAAVAPGYPFLSRYIAPRPVA